jgi:hypothetical protein
MESFFAIAVDKTNAFVIKVFANPDKANPLWDGKRRIFMERWPSYRRIKPVLFLFCIKDTTTGGRI